MNLVVTEPSLIGLEAEFVYKIDSMHLQTSVGFYCPLFFKKCKFVTKTLAYL